MWGVFKDTSLPVYFTPGRAVFYYVIVSDKMLRQPGTARTSIILFMIEMNVPGRGLIQLEHLVCDVNGTLAVDGHLIEGVGKVLPRLRDRLSIHLLTADTHGKQADLDRQLGLTAVRIQPGSEANQKQQYIQQLDASRVIAIGQGANDAAMLKSAVIGVCVLSREGTAVEALLAADLVVPNILVGLELIEKPLRLLASLRQ